MATGSVSASVSDFEDRLLDELRPRLRRQLTSIAETDAALASIGDPEAIAISMAKLLPSSHPFDSTVGPFYDTAGLTVWLGVTRQRLHQRTREVSLLACPVEGGASVYPTWQFQENVAYRVPAARHRSVIKRPAVVSVVAGTIVDEIGLSAWDRTGAGCSSFCARVGTVRLSARGREAPHVPNCGSVRRHRWH